VLVALFFALQVIRVSSNLGWSFELAIRAASDVALHDKYNMAGFLQVGSNHCRKQHCCLQTVDGLL
jgi:hypothetical protein